MEARLVMIPGTGCDARLFAPQRAAFPGLEVAEWLPPLLGETVREYAVRLAGAYAFPERFVLGGVSLGSMVAQELAAMVRPEKLVLIASARDWGCLWKARVLRPFVCAVPEPLLHGRGMAAAVATAVRFRGVRKEHAGEIGRMLAESRTGHLKWAMRSVSEWAPPETLACPMLWLHGTRDLTIPFPWGNASVTAIEGAGHLLNMTHAAEVNRRIAGFLAGGAGGTIGG
jgi:pimeloyl-ACP methyl ester carboxylesterase